MSNQRISLLVVLLVIASATMASAQPEDRGDWTGRIAFGTVLPLGDADEVLDRGWGFTGGGTYRPEGWPVGLFGDLGFNSFDAKKSAVQALGLDGADGLMRVLSLTTGVTWAPHTKGIVGFYLSGGGGAYRRQIEFTEPRVIDVGVCVPFWGVCVPGEAVTQEVIGSRATVDFGLNAGIGITFTLYNDTQIFIEARYNWIDTSGTSTQYIPVVVGWWF